MTVKELIEELQAISNQEAPVKFIADSDIVIGYESDITKVIEWGVISSRTLEVHLHDD